MKRKLLWIGDAAVSTGFAKVTHGVLGAFRDNWDVHILGLNYMGDPHEIQQHYQVYPCWPGGDAFGVGRLKGLLEKIKPDVVMILNDPWNIPFYTNEINGAVPVVASLAVDGMNCRSKDLVKLDHAIFWTEFGMQEAKNNGYVGPASVIPLGVDLDVYKPLDKVECRKKIGLPEKYWNSFIIGNVNRNQPRKRMDLTIEIFVRFLKAYNIDDAYLFLHVAPTGDQGYDVKQLMQYYGIKGKLILVIPEIRTGYEEREMAETYNAFDVQMTTTQGEGWGLTTMEGMACGTPQIVPDWSALGEWPLNAVRKVFCNGHVVTPGNINVIGGVPSVEHFVNEIYSMYADTNLREMYSNRGKLLVSADEYRWENIGQKYARTLEAMLRGEDANRNIQGNGTGEAPAAALQDEGRNAEACQASNGG
jgi:D-inositol-3-phosphate glycosyltransferase